LAGHKKIQNPRDVLVKLEDADVPDFLEAIKPYGISDYFRKVQCDVVKEYRKNQESGIGTLKPFMDEEDEKQVTLDLFKIEDKKELVDAVVNCQDINMIRRLREHAGLIVDITRTRLRKNN